MMIHGMMGFPQGYYGYNGYNPQNNHNSNNYGEGVAPCVGCHQIPSGSGIVSIIIKNW